MAQSLQAQLLTFVVALFVVFQAVSFLQPSLQPSWLQPRMTGPRTWLPFSSSVSTAGGPDVTGPSPETVCNQAAKGTHGVPVLPTGVWCLVLGDPAAPLYPLGMLSQATRQAGPWANYAGLAKGHVVADKGLANKLVTDLFAGHSVLDLGAGQGQYGYFFYADGERRKAQGLAPGVTKWVGYDGAVNIKSYTGGRVEKSDFTAPKFRPASGASFDWTMSLEVGEHIPAGPGSDTFVDNLVANTVCGLVISWGFPGQGGTGHVNELPPKEVVAKFESRGLKYDAPLSKAMCAAASYYWFQGGATTHPVYGKAPGSIMVFRATVDHGSRCK